MNEGICAMLALALLDASRELPASGPAWAALAHPDKHVLLHDRALGAATDDGRCSRQRLLQRFQIIRSDIGGGCRCDTGATKMYDRKM